MKNVFIEMDMPIERFILIEKNAYNDFNKKDIIYDFSDMEEALIYYLCYSIYAHHEMNKDKYNDYKKISDELR